MHVGYTAIFQNPDERISDTEVYQNELRLAELAEHEASVITAGEAPRLHA